MQSTMASVSIYVDEDLGANNDALAVSTPSRRAFGVLSANTPLRTPGSTRRGKAAIKAPISPLMKALETAKEPAKVGANLFFVPSRVHGVSGPVVRWYRPTLVKGGRIWG